jgi:hypothetical protein
MQELLTVKKDVAWCSETLVSYITRRCPNPENNYLNPHHRENLKPGSQNDIQITKKNYIYLFIYIYIISLPRSVYEGVSKSFRTGHLVQQLEMVELSATRCSCIAIL